MKFIHVGGDIADFGGYTFLFRNPVDVTNQATIASLLKNPKFKLCGVEGEMVNALNQVRTALKGKSCRKCGKPFSKGLYLHEKYCKG